MDLAQKDIMTILISYALFWGAILGLMFYIHKTLKNLKARTAKLSTPSESK